MNINFYDDSIEKTIAINEMKNYNEKKAADLAKWKGNNPQWASREVAWEHKNYITITDKDTGKILFAKQTDKRVAANEMKNYTDEVYTSSFYKKKLSGINFDISLQTPSDTARGRHPDWIDSNLEMKWTDLLK